MRKTYLLLLLLSAILFSSCSNDDDFPVEKETITIEKASYNIAIGDSAIVNLIFSNDDTKKDKVSWDIENKDIADIKKHTNNSYTIVGKAIGETFFKIKDDANFIVDSCKIIVNYPDIKKILWIGTSIPAGCTYPIKSTNNLGYECINKSIGASGICLGQGILGNGRDGRDLSETIAEKEARYTGYVSEEILNSYRNMSYEKVILPYLDEIQVIVFDHGYNDRNRIEDDINSGINWTSRDRATYIGAFNYLMDEIYKRKPSMRIIIGGYLENKSEQDIRGGKWVCQMQQEIADHYSYPLLDVWNYSGMTFDFVPNSSDYFTEFNMKYGTDYAPWITDSNGNITYFQLYNPDTVHPFTDETGQSDKLLDNIYTDLLRDILIR